MRPLRATAKSIAGSVTRTPPNRRSENIAIAEPDSTASLQAPREPWPVGPRPGRSLHDGEWPDDELATNACASTEQRPAPFERDSDARSRLLALFVPLTNSPEGSSTPADAPVVHFKTPDLVGGAEPVFNGTHQTQCGMAVAFEMKHDIDEVLE